MNNKRTLLAFIISQIILTASNYCQDFEVSHLIEIPGNNYDFDVLSPEWGRSDTETYICWINKLDSIYTVYLKQLSPIIGENIIVSSDSQFKSRPRIAFNKIAWQCKKNNIWKVYLKNFLKNQLNDSVLLLESIENDPEISLSIFRLAWINNSNLMIKEFYPDFADIILFDSLNCSNPEIIKYDNPHETMILYEKNNSDSLNINLIIYQHNGNSPPIIRKRCISNGIINKNPKYGINGQVTYQTFENNVWKSVYSIESEALYQEKTNNIYCSYNNPAFYTYPIATKSSSSRITPFFLVFDSDSIPNNHEVFYDPLYYQTEETNGILNISQSKGNDYNPRLAYTSTSDSVFISIFWQHEEENKMNIWMAKTPFSPRLGSINERKNNSLYFNVFQNYPNPFNSSTIIEYSVLKPGIVAISVYDVSGRKVKQILNEFKNTGNYKELVNLSDLPSGNYFYELKNGENIQTKSMILAK